MVKPLNYAALFAGLVMMAIGAISVNRSYMMMGNAKADLLTAIEYMQEASDDQKECALLLSRAENLADRARFPQRSAPKE